MAKHTSFNGVKRLKKALVLGFLFLVSIGIAFALSQLWQPIPKRPALSMIGDVAVAGEPIQPIPLDLDFDTRKVDLGNALFHDPQLSSNGTVSCATCHPLDQGGTDRLPISKGMGGSLTGLNSPTVYNIAFHSRFNWDGKAKTLEEQANGPIAAVGEMGGMSWSEVVDRLQRSPEYQTAFKAIYRDGVTPDTVRDAISVFQRSLYTPNAPFDQYLRGNESAIGSEEKQGYDLFKSYGCVSCHQGIAVGGNMFQTLGIFGDYFADRRTPVLEADLGRYNVTGNELDRHVFKVPSLRNIALTAPYFHDGNAATLDQAIKYMGKYQLGVEMPQKDVDLIMRFLRSLTGEYNGKPL